MKIRELSAPLKTALFATMIIFSSLRAESIQIKKSDFFASSRLGDIELFHDDEDGFYVIKDNDIHLIKNCFVDQVIRNISNEKLGYILGNIKNIEINGQTLIFVRSSTKEVSGLMENSSGITTIDEEESSKITSQLSSGAYLVLNEMSDGEYCLKLQQRLPGGGFWGASLGCWIGKFVASAICHTAIWAAGSVVSLVATPVVGGILICSLESTFGAAIETFTTAGAIAGGITLAVVTGPV